MPNKSRERRQKVLDSALSVFLKYGYKRTSMEDIAKSAGLSRPGLYLVFDTKQDILNAVLLNSSDRKLEKIKQGIDALKFPMDKFTFIFEVWIVEPFDWVCRSEDAKDFIDSMFFFAKEALEDGYAKLTSVLIPVIQAYPESGLPDGLSVEAIAGVLTDAARGFKQTSSSAAELRGKMHNLLQLVFRGKIKRAR